MTSQTESCWSVGWGGGGVLSYATASWGHLSSDGVAFVCRMGSRGGEGWLLEGEIILLCPSLHSALPFFKVNVK